MTNEAFLLLSEKKRNAKFKAVLNTKTKGCLTDEELRGILYAVPANRQYEIVVYHDPDDFCQGITRTEGARRRLVLGTSLVEVRKLDYDTQVQTMAVTIRKKMDSEELNQLHILIPSERCRKDVEIYE